VPQPERAALRLDARLEGAVDAEEVRRRGEAGEPGAAGDRQVERERRAARAEALRGLVELPGDVAVGRVARDERRERVDVGRHVDDDAQVEARLQHVVELQRLVRLAEAAGRLPLRLGEAGGAVDDAVEVVDVAQVRVAGGPVGGARGEAGRVLEVAEERGRPAAVLQLEVVHLSAELAELAVRRRLVVAVARDDAAGQELQRRERVGGGAGGRDVDLVVGRDPIGVAGAEGERGEAGQRGRGAAAPRAGGAPGGARPVGGRV
jgi:hypothetical protein